MVSCSVFLPKSCKGRRDTFKGRLLPNVAFWTRWPKYGAGRPASCKRRRKTGMQPTKKGAGGPGCCPPKACKEILLLLARAPLAVAWGRRITYHTHHTIYIVIHYTTPAPHTLHHTPPTTPQGEGDGTMADPWRWPGGLERWSIYIYVYIYMYIYICIYIYVYIYMYIYVCVYIYIYILYIYILYLFININIDIYTWTRDF